MKIVHWFLGMTAILSVIVILLISSFEIGIYSDFGWYEKEYEKYNVTEDLEMKMDDVMDVTEEMIVLGTPPNKRLRGSGCLDNCEWRKTGIF